MNCEGKAGWVEVIEMNLDLEETTLDQKMVSQLLTLTTTKPENWSVIYSNDKPRDYYIYVSYRIEHGNIVEILP